MTARGTAFEQGHVLTPVDRLGIWLSRRQIHKRVPGLDGKRVGDFGCGFQARFVRTVVDRVAQAVVVDVALAADLKVHPKVTAIEGRIPEALRQVESASLDVVLCVSVLEHLWEPLAALVEFRRIVARNGVCLFNVPSWRGKRFLEFSAFTLGLSPRDEMDDHKMYYDPRDLWPLLVRAGFRPYDIKVFRHKLGLNTFAVCHGER